PASKLGDEGEREVDAGGHAASGDAVPGTHHALLHRDGAETGAQLVRQPVGGSPMSPEEPGRSEDQGTGADAGDPRRAFSQGSDGVERSVVAQEGIDPGPT